MPSAPPDYRDYGAIPHKNLFGHVMWQPVHCGMAKYKHSGYTDWYVIQSGDEHRYTAVLFKTKRKAVKVAKEKHLKHLRNTYKPIGS